MKIKVPKKLKKKDYMSVKIFKKTFEMYKSLVEQDDGSTVNVEIILPPKLLIQLEKNLPDIFGESVKNKQEAITTWMNKKIPNHEEYEKENALEEANKGKYV